MTDEWYMILNESGDMVAIIKGEQTADSFLIEFEHNGKALAGGLSLNIDRWGNITGYLDMPMKKWRVLND